MACPASVVLTKDMPNESSKYADEGTAAHDLGRRALEHGKDCAFWIGEQIQVGKRVFTVDEEMAANVQIYVDDVKARAKGGELLVEQRVDISEAVGVPDQFGTSDAVIIQGDHLIVVDLKYGRGERVEAKRNPQGALYLLGTAHTFDLLGPFKRFTFVVSQPRLDHIDEYEFSPAELETVVHCGHAASGRITILLAAGVHEDIDYNPGEKQCRWCAAKPTCRALARSVSQAVYDDFEVVDDATEAAPEVNVGVPDENTDLATRFLKVRFIEEWCESIRTEMVRRIAEGIRIVGPDGEPYKMVEGGGGKRSWNDIAKAEAMLVGQLGDKAYAPRVPITAPAAAKLLNKKKTAATWELFENLITKSAGRPQLALGSDPRPVFSGAAGADEFMQEDDSAE